MTVSDTKPLILIADDEPELLSIYREKLEQAGFRVLTAANGEQAVRIATAERPDLILMDVKMPIIDGVAAQQKLKDNPATKDLKVVFLTAFSDPRALEIDEEYTRRIGALDFIKKGTSLDELVKRVWGYLKK